MLLSPIGNQLGRSARAAAGWPAALRRLGGAAPCNGVLQRNGAGRLYLRECTAIAQVHRRSVHYDYDHDPYAPPTPLTETVQALMHDVKRLPVAARVDRIAQTAGGDDSDFEKRVLVDGILTLLCTEFTFEAVRAFAANRAAFECAQTISPELLGRFLATGLEQLSTLGLDKEQHVLLAMQLYAVGIEPSKAATAALMEMADRLARGIRRATSSRRLVRACQHFLVAMARSSNGQHRSSDAWLRLVAAAMHQVGDGAPLLASAATAATADDDVEIDAAFAAATTHLGVRAEQPLEQFCRHVDRSVSAGRLATFSQAARFAHWVSILELPAPSDQLLLNLGRQYSRGDGCAWRDDPGTASIHDYITFCWAFVAGRFEPPERAALALCDRLQGLLDAGDTLPHDCLHELSQLTPHLPRRVPGLAWALVRALPRCFPEAARLARELGRRHELLRTHDVVSAGFVVAAGLLREKTGELVPWPEKFRSHMLQSNHLQALHGRPVALLHAGAQQMLVVGEGRTVPSALLERQREVMTRSGWLVAILSGAELEKSRQAGKDPMDVCRAAMVDAIAANLKRRKQRKHKDMYYGGLSRADGGDDDDDDDDDDDESPG